MFMAKTKAFGTHSPSGHLESIEIERRKLSPQDIKITVEYCGICHSDIHTARNEWSGTQYPCVPGHEIIGRVLELGDQVKRFKIDQRVGVGCLVDSCRECANCKAGEENYCLKELTWTYNSPHRQHRHLEKTTYTLGGYSREIVVDQSFVLEIPEGLDAAAAAPLLCAGITTYSPLKKLGVKKGHKLAVLGLGGLGHMAVKLAKAMGAEVSVLSRSASKAGDAKRLGADEFLLTKDGGQAYFGRFDFVIDTVQQNTISTKL